MKILYIEWYDSATATGWRKKDTDGPVIIKSVGYEIVRNTKWVTIATSYSSSERYMDQLSIPISCIKKIQEITT